MEGGTGDRGVSEVMGFILVFGMLVLSFTVYQGLVVPDQNRQVEFQHNQDVQGQLQDLRNAIVSTAATGSGQAVSVTLGASYPKRAIAQNLGVSGGSLQTTDAGRIRIDNARALDAETSDYLDGNERTFDTKSIRYTPVYSFYSGAPDTRYEHALLYNQFGSANLTLTDQVLVDGRRITLIAINGSLSASQRDTVSISTEAISASSNRVAVRNASGGPINVTIPTRLSVTEWEEALEDEMGTSGHVEGVYDVAGENAVNVSLEAGVTYELRMAKIGVGDVTSDEGPEYITAAEGDNSSVPEGGTQKLVVEVRDRFNNPVSNVTVLETTSPSWGNVSPDSATTDSDGQAIFTFTADSNVGGLQSDSVAFSFDDGMPVNERVEFELEVLDSDGTGGGGDGGDTGGTDTAGAGQYTDFQEDPNQTVSTSDGVWDGVTTLDSILMKKLYIRDSNGDPFEGKTVDFVLNFEIRERSSDETYTFEIDLRYDWSNNQWDKNKIIIEDGSTQIVNDGLDESKLDSIFLLQDGSGVLDLVGNASYQSDPWSPSEESDFKDFAGQDTYIYFTVVDGGSVEIEIN